ncbi:MAG: NUDIX domain-containing protein [Oscillospiraceae bacterium]|nr:NUDIX domain-containing protein [Oscillospiraceae bacterium]
MKKEKSCGALVFYLKDNKEQVLLIKHSNSGHWSFPKGHVEAGETEVQTAVREIKEETGVDVDIDTRFREVVTYSPKKDVIKDVIYFFAVAKGYETQKQESEVSEVRWVDADKVLKCVSYRNDKELVTKAIRFYKQHKKEIAK